MLRQTDSPLAVPQGNRVHVRVAASALRLVRHTGARSHWRRALEGCAQRDSGRAEGSGNAYMIVQVCNRRLGCCYNARSRPMCAAVTRMRYEALDTASFLRCSMKTCKLTSSVKTGAPAPSCPGTSVGQAGRRQRIRMAAKLCKGERGIVQ